LGSHNPKQNLFAVGQGNKIFSQVYPHIDKKNRILNVFEVGAAAGSVLNEFRESAKKNNFDCILSGLEYNREYVEAAKKLDVNLFSRELLDFVRSTKEKYDVIILSHVLEHTINPRQFLLEIKKIAKEKTGIIYIEVPGVFVLHKRLAYSAKFEKYFVHAHNFHFTKDSLSKLAYDSGFKCLSKNENVEMVLLNDENEEKIKFDADISVKNMRRYLFVLRKFRLFFLTLLIPLKITNFFTNLKNKNKSIE
jgi:SAM-dependent methyltransferase